MNSTIVYVYFLIIVVFCSGCDVETLTYDLTVSNTDTYFEELHCGFEAGVGIVVQAKHFEVSELLSDQTGFPCIFYKYTPEAGYRGKDYVKIKTNAESNRSGKGIEKFVEFNFTVTD